MYSISSMKPISSILSASSRTNILMSARFRALRSIMSLTLPGVPVTISVPFSNLEIWPSMDAPPYMATTSCPEYLAILPISSETWLASSLVGVSIIALGILPPASILPRIIEPKAPVLPVPVCAWANMSIPSMPAGIDSLCMGVGLSQPISAIAFATSSLTPISMKSLIMINLLPGTDPDIALMRPMIDEHLLNIYLTRLPVAQS